MTLKCYRSLALQDGADGMASLSLHVLDEAAKISGLEE